MDEASEFVKNHLLEGLKRKETLYDKLIMAYYVYYRFRMETNDTGTEPIYLYMNKLIINLLDMYIINDYRKCREYKLKSNVMEHDIVKCWFSPNFEMINSLVYSDPCT